MPQHNKAKAQSYSALFLTGIILHLFAELFVSVIANRYTVPLWLQLIISESTIILPGLIWMLIYNVPFREGLGFKKIKPATIAMSVLLAYLLMPLISLVNLISQLFTKNAVVSLSGEILSENTFVMIFIIGVFGPFCEEFVFRGIIGRGMSRFGSVLASAVVSGFFFGIMHMNLNQFCYAFVLGIIFAIVNYASGSVYTSMIMHTVVNGHNVLMLLAAVKLGKILGLDVGSDEFGVMAQDAVGSDTIYYMIGVFIILALIFTAASIPVFGFIAKHENHPDAYTKLINRPDFEQEKGKSQSWWLNTWSIISIVLCVIIMFWIKKLLMLLGM